jgi:hypothetical protein
MVLTTRSRSVAVARPSLLKSGRPSTTKGRLYQRYTRGYYINSIDVFFCIRSSGKIKCGLYIIAKYICVIVNRSLLI